MAYFEFPHTRNYEGDLGYIIKKVIELTDAYNTFFEFNTITFADPIQWDITRQYPAFQIVFDDNNEFSYISKQPVPKGITLDNGNYWSVVGSLLVDGEARTLIQRLLHYITNSYEAGPTASTVHYAGEFIINDGYLYKVISTINIGEYFSELNVEETTIEDMVTELVPVDQSLNADSSNAVANRPVTIKFNELLTMITAINNTVAHLNTELSNEVTNRRTADTDLEEMITANSEAITNEQVARESADNTLNARIDSIASLPSGSTSGDAELIDIRVGVGGGTYPSAGAAVRGQVGYIKGSLQNSRIMPVYGYDDLIDNFYVDYTTGLSIGNSNYCQTPYIPVKALDRITFEGYTAGGQLAYYDANRNFISGQRAHDKADFIVPGNNNIAFVRWCCQKSNKANVKIYIRTLWFTSRFDYDYMFGNNILRNYEIDDGYYVDYQTGTVIAAASWCITPYISVAPNDILGFTSPSHGSQLAFYDADFNYVSGMSSREALSIIVPNNANIKYMRWCVEIANKSGATIRKIGVNKVDSIYTITPAEGLLQGLKNAYSSGITKVVVTAGAYNVVNEYEQFFGANYFSSYTASYNGNVNGVWDYGLWLDNIDITFEPGARVTALYTGSNQYVISDFSPFAIGSNAKVKGLVLESQNMRYGIHPDFHPETYEHVVIDSCDLKHTDPSGRNRAIGSGVGIHSDWVISNCIFHTLTAAGVVAIHNNDSASSKSNITIKDCYIEGPGRFIIQYHGPSTEVSDVLIHGNSYEVEPELVQSKPEDTSINMNIIKYNNEMRA